MRPRLSDKSAKQLLDLLAMQDECNNPTELLEVLLDKAYSYYTTPYMAHNTQEVRTTHNGKETA